MGGEWGYNVRGVQSGGTMFIAVLRTSKFLAFVLTLNTTRNGDSIKNNRNQLRRQARRGSGFVGFKEL